MSFPQPLMASSGPDAGGPPGISTSSPVASNGGGSGGGGTGVVAQLLGSSTSTRSSLTRCVVKKKNSRAGSQDIAKIEWSQDTRYDQIEKGDIKQDTERTDVVDRFSYYYVKLEL
jgi:hypothetical protein